MLGLAVALSVSDYTHSQRAGRLRGRCLGTCAGLAQNSAIKALPQCQVASSYIGKAGFASGRDKFRYYASCLCFNPARSVKI